jgi:hypothetical protein
MPDHGGDLWIANTLSDLRLPWLAAGEEQHFTLGLDLSPGPHRLEVRL